MTRPLTGRGVLLWLAGFFLCVIAVNAGFVVASVKTFSGEDEQKPYLQGVAYNRILARRAGQRKLGWRASLAAERIAGAVRIRLALAAPDGTPERGLALHGELRHPMDENRDRAMTLKEVGAGLYQADIAGVAPGAWDVVVETADDQPPFEASRRLWLR